MVILAMIFSGEEHLRVQVDNNELIGRLFHCFTSRLSLQLPCFVAWLLLFWGGVCACVWFCGSWGALDDFFLTSSSRDMTATVLSNAALEKKKVHACCQLVLE